LNLYVDVRAFEEFGQAEFAFGSLVLGSSKFSLQPKVPEKMMLDSKVVDINSK